MSGLSVVQGPPVGARRWLRSGPTAPSSRKTEIVGPPLDHPDQHHARQAPPLAIKELPGGYAIHFADGRRAFIIYGRDARVARAAESFTTEEAKELAQEVARALTRRGAVMSRRDNLAKLRGLAGDAGYTVERAFRRNCWRLIDANGEPAINPRNGSRPGRGKGRGA